MSSILSSNLAALDNLLDDLSKAQEQAKTKCSSDRQTTPEQRPTVESLLDELESAVKEDSIPEKTSTATKELDDLISSLSNFKVKSYLDSSVCSLSSQDKSEKSTSGDSQSSSNRTSDDLKENAIPCPDDAPISELQYAQPCRKQVRHPQVASPQPSDVCENPLDNMLGSLQSDLNRQGVKTTAKGHCAACGKAIVGQVVTALGRTWHIDHFTCMHCKIPLGNQSFFERENNPYCESDYHRLFSPKCQSCNEAITDNCVTALDCTWHPHCFVCKKCGCEFGEDGFHERDGKPYCRTDYFELFAAKCAACGSPITENYISALSTQWHPECFVCMECQSAFVGGSFFDHEGMPYCETHYHAKRGSLCAGCGKPITGRCITAMHKKFHPEHFVCAFCLKQLNKGTFKEQNEKPYCHTCHNKIFQT